MRLREAHDLHDEVQELAEKLGDEILNPALPEGQTNIKRWQRHTLLSVLQYLEGGSEINLNP
jgi:hypothetical protein